MPTLVVFSKTTTNNTYTNDTTNWFLGRLTNASVNGVGPVRTFEQAAAKFVRENQHKRSIDDDVMHLKLLMPWIGRESIGHLE